MTKPQMIGLLALVVLLAGAYVHRSNPLSKNGDDGTPIDSQTGHYKISTADAGKTFTFKKGQQFELALNGLQGGAQWGLPEYDTSLIHLDAHYNTPATCDFPGCTIGDVWAFTAIAPGATDLMILEDRSRKDSGVQFKITIAVR